MNRINTRAITLAATLTALCFVTGLLPYVFFLPVMVAATTLSLGMTAFVGLAFGAVSIMYCFVMPASPVALAFIQAPYIALIPRMLAAMGAFGFYMLIKKFAKPKKKAACAATVGGAAAVGSLLNTALVVGLFLIVMPTMDFGGITMIAYVPMMLISGTIEVVCMAVLTPAISLTLDKFVLNRTRKKPKTSVAVAGVGAGASDVAPSVDIATEAADISPEPAKDGEIETTEE